MAQSPDYKALFLEEQRRRQAAEQRARDAEQQARDEGQRREALEQLTRNTTLSEYIGACHQYLFNATIVQSDQSLTTQGSTTKVTGKRCPTRLLPWSDFLESQKRILSSLYALDSTDLEQNFETIGFLQGLGRRIASRTLGSERDLELHQHQSVEMPVTVIVDRLRSLEDVAEQLYLDNGIKFDNHLNVLNDAAIDENEQPRGQHQSPSTPIRPHPVAGRLRVDQICVYDHSLAFIVEYKAAHKVTLLNLRASMREMDIYKEIVNRADKPHKDDEIALFQYNSDRLVGAVVTQTFDYMIEAGLEYSYITTGQGYIFLKIDWDNPGKLYFHLAEPEEETNAHLESFPHCTAVSQVLAFCLLVLESRHQNPRVIGQDERWNASKNLKTWIVDWEQVLREIPETERKHTSSPTPWLPQIYKGVNRSPYPLRLGSRLSRNCRSDADQSGQNRESSRSSSDSSDDDTTPNSPLQRKRPGGRGGGETKKLPLGRSYRSAGPPKRGKSQSYCTQRCLRGLIRGDVLDENCPNVTLHRQGAYGGNYHTLDRMTFLALIRQQLFQTLDTDCEPLKQQGARGAAFKVTLASHGYTVIAKGTVPRFVSDLQHEAAVYDRLLELQGIHVPVCLGNIDLDRPYYYDFRVRITHMLLLSWAGESCRNDDEGNEGQTQGEKEQRRLWTETLLSSLSSIHRTGVIHGDIRIDNVCWNKETGRLMLIDFERSTFFTPSRNPLTLVQSNLQRKWYSHEKNIKGRNSSSYSEQVGTEMFLAKSIFI